MQCKVEPDAIGKEPDFQMWPLSKDITIDAAYARDEYEVLKSSHLIDDYLFRTLTFSRISMMSQIFKWIKLLEMHSKSKIYVWLTTPSS